MATYNPKFPTEFDGKRALVVGAGHPHKGTFAICRGSIRTPSGIFAMVFQSEETREEFLVQTGADINWVK